MAAFVTGGLILLALAARIFWAGRRIPPRKGCSSRTPACPYPK